MLIKNTNEIWNSEFLVLPYSILFWLFSFWIDDILVNIAISMRIFPKFLKVNNEKSLIPFCISDNYYKDKFL